MQSHCLLQVKAEAVQGLVEMHLEAELLVELGTLGMRNAFFGTRAQHARERARRARCS